LRSILGVVRAGIYSKVIAKILQMRDRKVADLGFGIPTLGNVIRMDNSTVAELSFEELSFEAVNGGLSGEALRLRLTEQEQWEEAESVLDGRQPRVDPDNADLEELGDGTRIYRLHEVDGTMDDLPARISRRLVKRLEAGAWVSDIVVDSYQRAGGPPIPL
jgi:hypothetical protein